MPDALSSLRLQISPFALAVCDATPNTSIQEIIAQQTLRPEYLRHAPQGDAGQSAAINEGLRALPGDICTWLNADDRLMPGALAAIAGAHAHNPDADLFYGHSLLINAHGDFIGYFPNLMTDAAQILSGNCLAQPACFFTRRIFERLNGMDPDLNYAMDWDFWQRAVLAGARCVRIEQPLSVIMLHANTKTASGSWKRYQELARLGQRGRSALSSWKQVTRIALADKFGGFHAQQKFARLKRFFTHSEESFCGLGTPSGEIRQVAHIRLPVYNEKKITAVEMNIHGVKANKPDIKMELNNQRVALQTLSSKILCHDNITVLDHMLNIKLTTETPGVYVNRIRIKQ